MWFVINIREVNDMPAGTLLRVTKFNKWRIEVINEQTGQKVISPIGRAEDTYGIVLPKGAMYAEEQNPVSEPNQA